MNKFKFVKRNFLNLKFDTTVFADKNIWFWIFALFTFTLPLVSGTATNELYEFPKMFFVYFLGGSLVFVYVFRHVWYGKKFPYIPVYVKLYLFSFFLSTIFSMHFYTSFWGYYTRFNDCLVSTLVFFGLYLIMKENFDSLHFEKLFKIVLFSSIPISLIAMSQHTEMVRVYSTFGQPNWLAQFYAMFLPFAHYMYFTDPSVILWFVISVFGFAGLWFSYSLSGILGYAVGFVALLFLFRHKIWAKVNLRTNSYKLSFLLLVCGVIALTNLGVFKLRLQDVLSDVKNFVTQINIDPVFAQVNETTPSNSTGAEVPSGLQRNLSDPGYIRGGMWSGTLNLIFSSWRIALLGTGPETFPYAFQFFRPLALNYSSEWNFVFNKPHNYFLEVASEQGLFGLAIYLYLCFVLFKKLEKKYLPVFVAFVVTNIFGWPTVYTTFIFWMLLASLKDEHAH
jgi:putative inorganic carbon (hco3(-)) transporter